MRSRGWWRTDLGGSDLRRLRRQRVLLKVLLAAGFDFHKALQDPELLAISGPDPIPLLADVGVQWRMVVFDQVENAVVDCKSVLVRRKPVSKWLDIASRAAANIQSRAAARNV